ncbi:MAG: ATP-binding protein [Turneriella sp.]|nr:ATP-binding protein [Turneriella sp.]
MRKLAALWELYLSSGSQHFRTPTEQKLNRVLNLLFSLNFFANAYLIVIELIMFFILLQRDFDTYIRYFWPFAIINAAYPLLIVLIIYLKNRYGTFRFTYFSTAIFTTYCVILAAYLGEAVNIHVILLAVMPIVFIMYDYGRWKEILIHTAIMVAGIACCIYLYRTTKPLYPLPEDLARIAGYLCYAAAVALIFIYSVYNWKQVHRTEKLLAEEKQQVERLLGETIPKLELAEAKYRHLVDDSADMIFQMDEHGTILSMNKTARHLLGFNPEEMVGKNILDFVTNTGDDDPEFNRNIARAQMAELMASMELVRFRTTLRRKHLYDPAEVELTLQKNQFQNMTEILGKISQIQEDKSQYFLLKEKARYVIGNNIMHAEILSQKISERLSRYFADPMVNTLRICFREMLINAIEHGNLGITFEEKSRAMESGDYMEFLLARQKDPKYAHRQVVVDYLINSRTLIFRITDDGEGFDHKAFLEQITKEDHISFLEHGRGILLARSVFDKVVFNEKGNQVILLKAIPQPAKSAKPAFVPSA